MKPKHLDFKQLKKSGPASPISAILSLFHTLPKAFYPITALLQASKEPWAIGRTLISKITGMPAYLLQQSIGKKNNRI
ncbi:MAG: hypothetical protein H8D87_11465 [Deltaproteobacteria bacterium]|uniref:hypothetical protein n=1 Tax=Desulfobacula sp. TaxID=2593537 RepID=UPI0019A23472|nr:hypothetical protein [Candidatus Desulfobacula maris]MBL6993783.1 hypothetical protein [Desulfobacula sp.]